MISRTLYRSLALPFVDRARRTDSLAVYRALDKSQWLPRCELETLQLDRLKRLLVHAKEHVPYYRDLFGQCGFDPRRLQSVSDMSIIPFLTKDIIRREGHRLIADNAKEFQPRPHRSAGTTGQPIVLQMDRMRHSVGWADMYRWWNAGGWQLGDGQFVLAGAALRPRQLSGFRAHLYSRLNHFEDYSSFDLDVITLDRLLLRIERHRGRRFLRGYASSMHALAKHAAQREWSGRLDAIFTTAETLFPEQRKQIESALHGPVFDQWGCRDGGISAFECERFLGMHLAVENAVVEICRNDEAVTMGAEGEVVATDLFSYAMPIIRYKVGDVAAMATESCTCGRGLPLVASVLGRISEFLIGTGGRRIHGEFFSHVFWETPWVREFQIVQNQLGEIVVNIVRASEPPAGQLAQITRLMQEQAGADCRVRIEFVSDIPPGPMGKRQFVICRVPMS